MKNQAAIIVISVIFSSLISVAVTTAFIVLFVMPTHGHIDEIHAKKIVVQNGENIVRIEDGAIVANDAGFKKIESEVVNAEMTVSKYLVSDSMTVLEVISTEMSTGDLDVNRINGKFSK